MVLTPRQKRLWLTPDTVAAQLEQQCLPQALVPQDITGAVLFLASGASRMMSGHALVIDCGVVVSG